MLRYLSYLTLCDVAFVFFMVSWFITRHVLFVLVIISTYKDVPRYAPYRWDPKQGYFITAKVMGAFTSMLAFLEVNTHDTRSRMSSSRSV